MHAPGLPSAPKRTEDGLRKTDLVRADNRPSDLRTGPCQRDLAHSPSPLLRQLFHAPENRYV